MRELTMNVILFGLGLACGLLYASAVQPTQAELQREFDAYRTCMQSASKTRCSMQPSDFIRYYELQELIDAD